MQSPKDVQNLIACNNDSRRAKDELKEAIKGSRAAQIPENQIIVPGIQHAPSRIDDAMQWYFNGFTLAIDDGVMIIDPGVDFYTRFTATGYTAKDIKAVFVSHQHLDHCGDLNVFIDILAKTETPVDMYLPVNVVDGVLPAHYKELVEQNPNFNLIVMADDTSQATTPKWQSLQTLQVKQLHHSTKHTFGFKLQIAGKTVAYISDTGYATTIQTTNGIEPANAATGEYISIVNKYTDIQEFAKDVDTLACNVNDLFYNRHSVTHMSGWDLHDILGEARVSKLLLLHLNPRDSQGNNLNDVYQKFFATNSRQVVLPDGNKTTLGL